MESKRQQEGISKKNIPWWLHLCIAILSYSAIKFFLPTLASDQAGREQFTELGNQIAPIIAIIFLLLAANALFKDVPKSTPDSDNPNEQTENDKP